MNDTSPHYETYEYVFLAGNLGVQKKKKSNCLRNTLTSPKPRDGLRDTKHGRNGTFHDGLATSGVWGAGTLRAVTTSNLFPNTQVPPPSSSLAEYYGMYNLPRCHLSFIISLQGILLSPFPTYILIFQQRLSC